MTTVTAPAEPAAVSAARSRWWQVVARLVRWVFVRALVTPKSAWPLAIARVCLGVVLLGWSVSFLFDVGTFLSPDGVAPVSTRNNFGWGGWHALTTQRSATVALVVLMVCAVALIIGAFPGIASVVAFGLLVAVQRRVPSLVNSGDLVLRNLIGMLALTPSAAALSVHRWQRYGRDALATAPLIAPWGMRVMQIQLSVVYFFACYEKQGRLWDDGVAVSTALRLDDLQRVAIPSLFFENSLIVHALTWGTLVIEACTAVLLWVRPARPYVLIAVISLHLGIELTMLVGFFGTTMIAGLMVFLSDDRARRIAHGFLRGSRLVHRDVVGAAVPPPIESGASPIAAARAWLTARSQGS